MGGVIGLAISERRDPEWRLLNRDVSFPADRTSRAPAPPR
jgi:hypothetical protein